MAGSEYFDPRNPHIGFSGRDQDKPQGIQIGNSESIKKLGELMGGDQGFENTQDAVIREYGSSVSIASLGARVSSLEAQISVDATFSDNFNRGFDSSTLGSQKPGTIANWIQFGDGQGMGIENDAAVLSREALFNLIDDGTQYAVCPVPAGGDDYAVIGIVNPRQERLSTRARTTLYGRCNSGATDGIYADFYGDRCALGRFTRNGLTVVRTQWKARDRSIGQASTFELQMDENLYRVVVDGEVLIDHIDDTGAPRDATHRSAMFSEMCWTPPLGSFGQAAEFSVGVTGFAIRSIDLSAVQKATAAAAAATTAAGNAEAAAGAVLGIAENADAKASEAQETANAALDSVQDVLNGAQQTGETFMVSSAGVQFGRNELQFGPPVIVPPGRDFRLTSVTYGLDQNTGGIAIELLKISPTRVPTVIHTANLSSGQLEFQATGLNVPIENRYRYACNVIGIVGTSSVLLCTVAGALL